MCGSVGATDIGEQIICFTNNVCIHRDIRDSTGFTQTALELHNGTNSTDQYWFGTSFGISGQGLDFSCLDLWCVTSSLSMNVLHLILVNDSDIISFQQNH